MASLFLDGPDWVLSGSLEGWGDSLAARFDAVIFLAVPTALRLEGRRAREARRFGLDAVAPGAWRHRESEDFLGWASHCQDGGREGRSLPRHEAWLAALTCPALRLDGSRPTPALVERTIEALGLRT
jgi:hypothetical protein